METLQMSVVDGVARAVRDHPDRDALRTVDTTISYRRFGELVEDVAHRIEAGTVPGEFVGIQADRGAGAIVAMVGAMRAGRPFVFVDRRDSEASNSEKLRLLGVRVLARPGAGDDPVRLTEVPDRWRCADAAPTDLPFAAGELCYAIQTSGSTGKPKCVLVRTAPLAAVIRDHVDRLGIGPGDTTLQFARLTFDGCITEILWTLTAGARLVVLDEAYLAPGPVLQNTLERFGVTHLKTTPFALTVTEPTTAMSLKHVINGGGACRPAVLRRWSAVASFHNAYGLTETTVCNLLTDPLDADDCAESVPLGELVGDCDYQIRDLDDPAATATRGELVITGNSVAAGYLTERGVQPFGTPGETAAYHTGDVVEARAGRLYYVERRDRQVKVRGYRLDPGEIESAVCRLPEVRDAVVVAETHDGADAADLAALVCYYQGDADARAVRRHLEGQLDPYKIPSVFTRVEVFPHTRNGKVDRDALQAGRLAAAEAGGPTAPATDAGQEVLRLVRTLTGVEDVGPNDNFFDVGGDSASAVVLVTRLKELGWVDVGVRDVLRAEDLRALTDRLPERSV
ncbi:non-ribosomal peptide synthetase [Micromonospora sp. WMMA1923]|uniref:non-ribosomal peptide synthetase n=1 Tax=Micromonospora sp. WMMA1923 TaxID=3404125 RepID=UPI003B9379CC